MASNDDTRVIICDSLEMSRSAATPQSTILRQEPIRIRHAFLFGVLAAAATTRVFISGVKDPIMLSFTGLVEGNTASNWTGYGYNEGATAAQAFQLTWDDYQHGTSANRNSFVFTNVGANLQSHRYRIYCTYTERI